MFGAISLVTVVHRQCRRMLLPLLTLSAVVLSMDALASDPSLADLEGRVDAALEQAETALDREESRLDELAARSSGRPLADGRPSLGQVAANIRLLDGRIRELRAEKQELHEELKDMLSALGPDIMALAQRLSAVQSEQAEHGERDEAAHGLAVGSRFRDCPECPEMIVVPPGRFDMGSPPTEVGRHDNEGPVHPVAIGYRFAVGVHEVTRGEFELFVSETGRATGNACWAWDGKWRERSGTGWRNPGFVQGDRHPVTCVSWNDAKAYARWLSERTSGAYRLLSESEWEYVARAGTTTARFWGADAATQCRYANGADSSTEYPRAAGCDDGHSQTSPTGSYDANDFGLHDVLGNVFEWLEDCWNDSYRGAPSDGGAWEAGDCERRVFRGGAWLNESRFLRSAFRVRYAPGYRSNVLGFRVARTLAQ